MKKRDGFRAERGSATLVEMCFVFPIVLMVIFTLLYMGLYFLQVTVVTSYAQRAAVYVSRMVAVPGYDEFGVLAEDNDFSYGEKQVPGADVIKKVVSQHEPYRFFFPGNSMIKNKQDEVENSLLKLLEASSFLGGRNLSCEIEVENQFLFQNVTVTVTQTMDAPFFMTYLGLDKKLELKTSIEAGATCPTEFVRNVDIVYDLVDTLMQKLHIGSLDGAIQKIKEMKDKFKM